MAEKLSFEVNVKNTMDGQSRMVRIVVSTKSKVSTFFNLEKIPHMEA